MADYWPAAPEPADLIRAKHRIRRCGSPAAPNAVGIKAAMLRLEWDPEILADRAGVSKATVSYLLTGHPVSAETLEAVDDALRVATPRVRVRAPWMTAVVKRRFAARSPTERYARLLREMEEVVAEIEREKRRPPQPDDEVGAPRLRRGACGIPRAEDGGAMRTAAGAL